MNELVETKINALITPEAIKAFIDFKENEAKWNLFKSGIEENLKTLMRENGIKKFESDNLRITYIEATTRKSVDTKRLKEEGLYDFYLKESPVKDSVRIELKYDD